MKQHITQEQAVELDDQADKLAEQELQDIGEFHPDHWKVATKHLCNLAIQHYIDQRVKDLPALPNFPYIPPIEQRGAWIKWGKQCAAYAREVALSEAKDVILNFQAGWVPDGFTECADRIEALKKSGK